MYQEKMVKLLAQYVDQANAHGGRYIHALETLMRKMPSGSGIDSGTKLLLEESNKAKLVFQVDYHHVDQNGCYCGWSTRKVVITPSLIDDFHMDFTDEDASGADLTTWDELEETGEESPIDDSESILEQTNDYIADWLRQTLNEYVEVSMSLFEPAKLGFHGELVR